MQYVCIYNIGGNNMGDLKKKNINHNQENPSNIEEQQIIEKLRIYIQKFYELQEKKMEQENQEKEDS